MSKEAIILAGGLGTRLKGIIEDIPKPMAPINNQPFLQYLLNYLHNEGIEKVILSVGYKHHVISDYFGQVYKGMNLEYAIEDEPLGTGGAIALALQKSTQKNVFILNGDTLFPISLNNLYKFHIETGSEITLALKEIVNANRFGSVSLNEDKVITSFTEKSSAKNTSINGGIYVLNKEKFNLRSFSDKFSFEKDYLEKIVFEHCISGVVFNKYFIDIGIPETYQKAQMDFLRFK